MGATISQAAFTAALFDPAANPAGLTSARGEPDPLRFNVYRNNVAVALIGTLEQRFPVTRRLVGEGRFRMLAHAHMATCKPSSPVIATYGDGLPDFIESFEPLTDVRYLADVARIEAAWTNAYHAADMAPATLETFAALAPETLPGTRLTPHPSAALVSSPYPVGSIWAAHQVEPLVPVKDWRTETVLIARPDMEVGVHIIPPADAPFVRALFAGESLGEAAEAASIDEAFDFGTALVGLLSLGAIASITSSEGEPE